MHATHPLPLLKRYSITGKRINESLPNSITPEMEGKERSCEIKDISWMHQVRPDCCNADCTSLACLTLGIQVSLPGSLVVVATGIQSNPKNGQSNRFYQVLPLMLPLMMVRTLLKNCLTTVHPLQTFVLASEQGQANAFYVHNDMSCLTAVDAPPMVAAPAPHPAPTMVSRPRIHAPVIAILCMPTNYNSMIM